MTDVKQLLSDYIKKVQNVEIQMTDQDNDLEKGAFSGYTKETD